MSERAMATGPGPESSVVQIAEWFATSYGDPSARVLRALPRATGGLYQIAGDGGQTWLRVGGALSRDRAAVETEARVAAELVERQLPVSVPRIRVDGAFAGSIDLGGRAQLAVAYQHVDGEDVSRPSPPQARALGRVLAALHAAPLPEIASAAQLPVVDPIRTAREGARLSRRWLGGSDGSWLDRTVAAALERLERLAVLEPRRSAGAGDSRRWVVCHGDLRLGNVRFQDDDPVLIDLETLGRGPRSYDLGCLWRRRVIESDFTAVPEDWRWFREGYARALGLEDHEWQAVPLLALLRAAWTMCLPARGGGWGVAWLRDPDYWAAHLRMVRWFAAAAG